MKFNEKLLKLREKNNLSQEELAEKLNVTRQTISKWEMGNCYTDMGKLTELCNIFNCSLHDLLDDGVLTNNTVVVKKDVNKKLILIITIVLIIVAFIACKVFLEYKLLKNTLQIAEQTYLDNKNNSYSSYEGEIISGFDVIRLINTVNSNNINLKNEKIDSFRERMNWCVYISSETLTKDTNHKEIKFYEYSDDITNYPYTQYDISVIDYYKYYTVTTEWNSYHLDRDFRRVTKINITEIVNPQEYESSSL